MELLGRGRRKPWRLRPGAAGWSARYKPAGRHDSLTRQRVIYALEFKGCRRVTEPATANAVPSQAPHHSPKYWAFISYSHRDSRWAEWLHKGLESYHPPKALVGNGDGARRGAETHVTRVPRPRRAAERDRPRRTDQRGTRAVQLPDRDLFASGGQVQMGQRRNPGIQAAGPRRPDFLSDRRRRAQCDRHAGPGGGGVLPTGIALPARAPTARSAKRAPSRSRPTPVKARTVRVAPSSRSSLACWGWDTTRWRSASASAAIAGCS